MVIRKGSEYMSIELKADIGYTSKSVEFYKRYKDAFGEVVKAKMDGNENKGNYKLVLTNKDKEELIFEGGLTSGYLGEGCRGTQKVLQLAGFDITDEFIKNHVSFELKK